MEVKFLTGILFDDFIVHGGEDGLLFVFFLEKYFEVVVVFFEGIDVIDSI